MLTVRLTFPPCLRWVPGFGFCEATRPFFALVEETCSTFPAEQKWAASARLAAASVLPVTFGTTQFASANFAVTARAPFAVSLHVLLPLHAPDQPAKLEPREGFAFRVTRMPNVNACEQVFCEQLIPDGVLVTFPPPFPDRWTVRVCAAVGCT